MGIWDRLGSVINSYLNDMAGERSGESVFRRSGDPDLDAAYDELNDYLNQGSGSGKKEREYKWKDTADNDSQTGSRQSAGKNLPPEELRADFECLGVSFGADIETCRIAYKNLLKIHHPDRHIGHEGNYKKATERSAKINAAWDRIEKWQQEKK